MQQRTVSLIAGICVSFDEPHLVISINHEIKPQQFKVVASSLRVNFRSSSTQDICSYLLHFWVNHLLEVKFLI